MNAIAAALRAEVERTAAGAKRLKPVPYWPSSACQAYGRHTAEITRLLSTAGLTLSPPIFRFGDDWEITPDDWIYLSAEVPEAPPNVPLPRLLHIKDAL